MSETADGATSEGALGAPALGRAARSAQDGFAAEWFSGEQVLEDLEGGNAEAAPAARLVLVRFLAAQYFTNLLRADWPPHLLRLERSAALNALGPGVALDRELRALHAALDSCQGEWRRTVVRLLLKGAAAARARPHPRGALALYRIAFEASVSRRWWAEAAAAAQEIAELGRLLPDVGAARRWRRRAGTLARAAARESSAG